MNAHPYVARGQHDLGRVLRTRGKPGDKKRADQELASALGLAERLGMLTLAERIRTVHG